MQCKNGYMLINYAKKSDQQFATVWYSSHCKNQESKSLYKTSIGDTNKGCHSSTLKFGRKKGRTLPKFCKEMDQKLENEAHVSFQC